jgi:tetratricopeptide (TPR) repeat protein
VSSPSSGFLVPVLALASCLVLSACHLLRLHGPRSPAHARLLAIESLLENWEDARSLSEAFVQLGALRDAYPDDPEVLAALAKAYYAWAWGHAPEEPSPEILYEKGREAAWTCLETNPAFRAQLQKSGGRVDTQVARQVQPEQAACLAWLLACWTRWDEGRGVAAITLDTPPLLALATRLRELADPAKQPDLQADLRIDLQGMALHESARILALQPPSYAPDLEQASAWFEEALRLRPEHLWIAVDYARLLPDPKGREGRGRSLLEAVARRDPGAGERVLENRRAVLVARSLLIREGESDDREGP